jgi:hypothetical protein
VIVFAFSYEQQRKCRNDSNWPDIDAKPNDRNYGRAYKPMDALFWLSAPDEPEGYDYRQRE